LTFFFGSTFIEKRNNVELKVRIMALLVGC